MMDLSPPEHEHSAAVDLAAEWLAQPVRETLSRPLIPLLQERFGLSITEAVEACRHATQIRQEAADGTS